MTQSPPTLLRRGLRIIDHLPQSFATLVVVSREKPEEDDWQHIALVVGWLDRSSETNGCLPQLLQKLGVRRSAVRYAQLNICACAGFRR